MRLKKMFKQTDIRKGTRKCLNRGNGIRTHDLTFLTGMLYPLSYAKKYYRL